MTASVSIAVQTTVLMPWLTRSLSAFLKAAPQAYGWCRTRWSCATLAAELKTKHGLEVSAWTVRRWLHALGWVWKRAKLLAKDDDPQRVARAPTVSRVSTGVSQLRDFLDVRDRSARPACLGEEIERHVLVVADRREGLIHIRPRLWIARDGHLP